MARKRLHLNNPILKIIPQEIKEYWFKIYPKLFWFKTQYNTNAIYVMIKTEFFHCPQQVFLCNFYKNSTKPIEYNYGDFTNPPITFFGGSEKEILSFIKLRAFS